MAVLYVKEQNAYVIKKQEKIAVKKKEQILMELPAANIDQVIILGNAQISTQALYYLLEQGVDISYFTYGGKLVGQTKADTSKNIFLRFAQYDLFQNQEKKMQLAKILLDAKIHNQMKMLENYRWKPEDREWKEEIKSIRKNREKLEQCETNASLMGVEGICSNIYFRTYGRMFQSEIRFDGRNRRPPKDPVNVLLSLAYTFLTKDMNVILDSNSFETYLGFLHGIRYGRKSLALDMIEPFRQPFVDAMVLKMFNKGMIGKYDFSMEEENIHLKEEGFQKFCKEYERWMSGFDGKKGYRLIMKEQVQNLKNAIQKQESFVPFKMME